MTFGWTWEYIDDFMTIPRLEEISKYWKRFPPLHEMIASYLGLGDGAPAGSGSPGSSEIGTMDDLLREFGEAGGIIDQSVWN